MLGGKKKGRRRNGDMTEREEDSRENPPIVTVFRDVKKRGKRGKGTESFPCNGEGERRKDRGRGDGKSFGLSSALQ